LHIYEVKFQNPGTSWDEVKGVRSPSQASEQVDLLERIENHKQEGAERKKTVETRDLALVARQLGVAYKYWKLLCCAIYQA
jgi:NACalpha-BTF3-like transcription factor